MYQEKHLARECKGHLPVAFTNPELMEYQQLKQEVDRLEANLEEFCAAIEEFGVFGAAPSTDTRVIYCSMQSYTPAALLARAQEESCALEAATLRANEARGRVLAKILNESKNLSEYRAVRWLYVDACEHGEGGMQFGKPEGFIS